MSEEKELRITSGRRCEACQRPLPRDATDAVCAACREAQAAAAPSAPEAATPAADAAEEPPTPAEERAAHEGESVPEHGAFHGHTIPPGEEPRWIDHPHNVRKLIYGFWGVCALVLAIDLLDLAGVLYHKHTHFSWEGVPGFYGIYGFVACVALVLLAKQLRKAVMRREDYYDA